MTHALSDLSKTNASAWWSTAAGRAEFLGHLLTALIIAAVTLFIADLVYRGVKKVTRRVVQNDADRTFPEFMAQVVRWMILMVGLVAVLNRLGVATASVLTMLGAASLAIGLALQGTLGNVASGLIILLARPYRNGDSIRLGEVQGRVRRLGLFSTEIDTVEGPRAYVPNAKAFSNEIINITSNATVRVEVLVDVGYETDLNRALDLLGGVARSQPEQVEGHDPVAALVAFAASGITVRVAIWVMPSHAIAARNALMIGIKQALDDAAIEIPYPHQVEISKNASQKV